MKDELSLNQINNYGDTNKISSINSEQDLTDIKDFEPMADFSFSQIMDSQEDAETRYKYLFENNPNAMYIWDIANFCIVDCNEEALLKYGYTRQEFLNLTVSDLQFVEDLLLLDSLAVKTFSEKQYWRQKKKNDEVMFMEVSSHLLNYKNKTFSFTQVIDVTEKEQALAQLKESQDKLRTATKIARLGYWQLKADGTNRYWSDEVYEIWGRKRNEFIVTFDTFLETIYPADKEAFLNEQRAFYSWKKTFDLEYRIILPDGAIKWVCERGKLLEDEAGNPIIFQGMVQDITEQKLLSSSLEESNRRYNYVTKATFDAIWDWDMTTGALYWGEGFQHIFGYELKDLQPDISSWTQHLHPADQERAIKSIYDFILSTGTNWEEEYRYLKADGQYAYVADKGFVVRDEFGKAIRMVGAMQDVSKRKKDEEELKAFADELYKRNKELHEFGYIVSHNLRSPVANIMGTTTLLELDSEDPETVTQCIKDLKSSINRLDDVIRDLSKILSVTDGSAAWSKETVDVKEILDNVITDLQITIKHSGADIQIPQQSCILYSHKAYLYSALFNLIGNAIKYRSAKKPEILIQIDQSALETKIKISDNGIGIDLVKHGDDLFKPYKRFATEIEGKGLGLFLVKSHVEALRGTITVESNIGVGTSFIITFAAN